MSKSLKYVGAAVGACALFGFVLPALVSAPSDLAVLLAVAICIGLTVFVSRAIEKRLNKRGS